MYFFSRNSNTQRFGFFFTAQGFGVSNCDFSLVFPFDSQCIGFRNFDTTIAIGFGFTDRLKLLSFSNPYSFIFLSLGDANLFIFLSNSDFHISIAVCFGYLGIFLTVGKGFTSFPYFLLFSHTNFCLVDSFRSRFFTKSFNITRLVFDIGYVYVDEF